MDSVLITENPTVKAGLEKMMATAMGENGYVATFVEVPVALYIIEVAKRAMDYEDWFPHGKWATIQAIQNRVEKEFETLFDK